MTTLFASFHHLAVLTLLGCTLTAIVQLRRPLDIPRARLLRTTDMINGIAATMVLVVGVVRMVYLEKGADYYLHNGPFLAKLVLYGVASVLSLVPTLEVMRWRAPLKQAVLPTVRPEQLGRMRTVAILQLVCLLAMMVCANLAAR
ncbi:MAG: DUF2214 family protein [Pseudomonadota bacterium]